MKVYWRILLSLVIISGCSDSNHTPSQEQADDQVSEEGIGIKISGPTQGTSYNITYLGTTENYQSSIDSLLETFDQDLSLWVEGSLINRINAHASRDTTFSFIDSTKYFSVIFDLSREIYRKTNGAFDPSVYPLVKAWGFGQEEGIDPSPEMIDSIRNSSGFDELSIDMIENYENTYYYVNTDIFKGMPTTQLDFNAIAQGYSVDVVANFLDEKGLENYMVEIGGEIYVRGLNPQGKPWLLAVEDPMGDAGEKKQKAHVELSNKAIATSGSYRQFYLKDGVRYSHTINPITGTSVTHSMLSVSVVANSCAEADAYATAFMVLGTDGIQEFLNNYPDSGLELYFIYDDGGTIKTGMTEGMAKILKEI